MKVITDDATLKIDDTTNLEYFPNEHVFASCKLKKLKPEFEEDMDARELTDDVVDPNVYASVLVTDSRIVGRVSDIKEAKPEYAIENGSGGGLLDCICCCFAKTNVGMATKKYVNMTEMVFQAADLKDIVFNQYENMSRMQAVQTSGCCTSKPSVKPLGDASTQIVAVEITLTFAKKTADMMPTWDKDPDLKTFYKTVVLKGNIEAKKAASLRRALMMHDGLLKPSAPGAQSIQIVAGGGNDNGNGMGLPSLAPMNLLGKK